MQAAIWDRILNLPVPFFRRYSAGDLATRGMAISEMRRVLSSAALSSIFTAAFSVFSYALLFYFSVRLALVATALTALALLLTAACGFLYVRYQREIFNIQGAIAGTLLAGRAGDREVPHRRRGGPRICELGDGICEAEGGDGANGAAEPGDARLQRGLSALRRDLHLLS